MEHRSFYVYILTTRKNTVLYVGITRDLWGRIVLHRSGEGSEFAHRYSVTKLVYYERFDDPFSAIAREKQLKAGSRKRKRNLVTSFNPEWRELAPDL